MTPTSPTVVRLARAWQGRLQLFEQPGCFLKGVWPGLQDGAHVGVVADDLSGDGVELARPRPQRIDALGLRVEQRRAVLDQRSRPVGRRVGVGGDPRPGIEQRSDVVSGAVEGLERLVEQVGEPVLRHAADECTELIEDGTHLLWDGRVLASDERAVCQERRPVAQGNQVDVLFSHRGNAAYVGLHVRGNPWRGLQGQLCRRPPWSRCHARHLADLNPPVGDVAEPVKTSSSGQLDRYGDVPDAEPRRHL